MTITSWSDVLLEPIYRQFGVDIDFVLANDDMISLVGLDKSGGVEIATADINVPSIHPACVIRMVDLIELGYAPEDLMEAVLSLNGVSWKVMSYYPRPSPRGENDGELYIVLAEAPL